MEPSSILDLARCWRYSGFLRMVVLRVQPPMRTGYAGLDGRVREMIQVVQVTLVILYDRSALSISRAPREFALFSEAKSLSNEANRAGNQGTR